MRKSSKAKSSKVLFARKMRKAPTPAEEILWERLRMRRLGGYKFRNQSVILGWIVDFYCPAAKLVVEVDGGYHDIPEQKRKDAYRADCMRRQCGLRTIRFTNEDVLTRLKYVQAAILNELQARPNPARALCSSELQPTG